MWQGGDEGCKASVQIMEEGGKSSKMLKRQKDKKTKKHLKRQNVKKFYCHYSYVQVYIEMKRHCGATKNTVKNNTISAVIQQCNTYKTKPIINIYKIFVI